MSAIAVANRYATPIRWLSALLIVAAVLLTLRALPVGQAIDALRLWIDDLGAWGPAAFALIYVVATVLLLPGSAITLAGGAVFGLVEGMVAVSVGSTTGAALAFLISRYLARDRVARLAERRPRFRAVDRAISQGGWRIVAMLRLSPAIPFNLQNYLYGLTAIRFWPYVLASWLFMLPGTFMYVYLGHLGGAGLEAAATGGAGTGVFRWAMRIVGLVATVAVTLYITRLASRAIRQQTAIQAAPGTGREGDERGSVQMRWPWGTTVTALIAVVSIGCAVYAQLHAGSMRRLLGGLFGPPRVTLAERYADGSGGPAFDHSVYDALLDRHVDGAGFVDYEGLGRDAERLDAYISSLSAAPFDEMSRDEKLALLINAYNAYTLRLILDHWPVDSIRDIPSRQRWDAERWNVGGHVWSLDQIEHEQIRPNFVEPRIHFALVCAAVGCPPLRNESYRADRLEAQLDQQARIVFGHDRWFRYDAGANEVHLTRLFDWYGDDFSQVAGSVLEYAARYSPELRQALEGGEPPEIRWLDYDWSLNAAGNTER